MSLKVIAFGHRRRVGKDTAVMFALNHLKSRGIRDCQRLSMFAQIKNLAAKLYGWGGLEDEVYYENHPKLKEVILPAVGKSPRQIWIELGEALYVICPHMLCELSFQGLKDGYYLISDMRREIEADYVEKFNGYRVKIINPRIPETDDPVDCGLMNYDRWTHTIVNDGTMREFNTKVVNLIQELTGVK